MIEPAEMLFYKSKKGLFNSRSVRDKRWREIVYFLIIKTALLVSGEVGVLLVPDTDCSPGGSRYGNRSHCIHSDNWAGVALSSSCLDPISNLTILSRVKQRGLASSGIYVSGAILMGDRTIHYQLVLEKWINTGINLKHEQ